MAKGYIIARVRIDDLEQYQKYMAVSPDALGAFDGKFLVRGGDNVTVEGDPENRRLVVVEFPSYAAARECYQSEVYQEARKLRAHAGDAQFVVVEGVE